MTDRTGVHRPTLEAVARRAGVSRSTVSRVINGQPKVRAEVVERVQEVVTELGYVPNQIARSLVTRRNNAVAVVITEPQNRLFVDPFFALQLHGIRRELVEQGSQPVLLFIEEPDDYARVGDFLGGGHVDGALLFSLHADDPLPAMTDRLGLPAVFGAGRWPDRPNGPAATSTWTRTTGAVPVKRCAISSGWAVSASGRSPDRWTRPPRWTGWTAIATCSRTPRRS